MIAMALITFFFFISDYFDFDKSVDKSMKPDKNPRKNITSYENILKKKLILLSICWLVIQQNQLL